MQTKLWLALVMTLLLAFATPAAWAQSQVSNEQMCTGGSIVIDKTNETKSLLLFGCQATIKSSATVHADVVSFGGNIMVEPGATVQSDIVSFGGNVAVGQGALVKGVLVAIGNTVRLEGEIGTSLVLVASRVEMGPTAKVNGDVHLAAATVDKAERAVVVGRLIEESGWRAGWSTAPVLVEPLGTTAQTWNGGSRGGLGAVALAVLAIFLVLVFPQPIQCVMQTTQQAWVCSFGIGLLTLIGLPILMVALAITIIGIPLVGVLAVALVLAWYVGWIAVSYGVGQWVTRLVRGGEGSTWLAAGLGVLLMTLLSQVPFIGGLVGLLVGLVGFGAVVISRFGTRSYVALPTSTLNVTPATGMVNR